MPNNKQQEVIPRTLSDMIKSQVALVAMARFSLPLSMRATLTEMVASVSALMKKVAFCPNTECGAGTANCDPAAHLFEPSEYMEDVENPPVVRVGAENLDTNQLDLSIGSNSSPAVTPGLGQQVVEEEQDPQLRLAMQALTDAGLDPAVYLATGQAAPTPGGSGGLPPSIPTQPPQAAAHVPPPAGGPPATSLEVSMARMITVLENQQKARTQELELQKAQLNLTEALQRQVAAPRSDTVPEEGRVAAVQPRNTVALGLSGCTLGNQFGLQGDITKVDMSKKGKLLNSGRDPVAQLKAIVPETWPNQFLHPVIWNKIVKYEQLTLLSFAVGFVTKVFSEFEPACLGCGKNRNGSREHNMLRILMELLKVVETHSFQDAHMLGECLFSGLERGTLSWENWDGPQGLGAWWAQMHGALQARSGVFKNKRPRPAEDGDQILSKPPKAQALDPNRPVMGVPGDWLKAKKICINWNLGKCKQSGTHDTYDKTGKVIHVCGGCFYLGRSESADHTMKSCSNKNAKGVFC